MTTNTQESEKFKKDEMEKTILFLEELDKKKNFAESAFLNFEYQPMFPTYNDFSTGEWRIRNEELNIPTKDYYGIIRGGKTVTLSKINGDEQGIWMSTTPMELESHILHINSLVKIATERWNKNKEIATIVIGGLGMGMYLINCLHYLYSNKTPVNIHVIEKSNQMQKILHNSLEGYCRELFDYSLGHDIDQVVTIHNNDLLTMTPVVKHIDYMYVDIWQHLASEDAKKQSFDLVKKWKPKTYGYWGEELDVACQKELIKELPLSNEYNNPNIIKACEYIFEGQFGLPPCEKFSV